MTTDKINEKLLRMAKEELEEVATEFIELLKKKYPNMYETHTSKIEVPGGYFYAKVKEKVATHDTYLFRTGSGIQSLENVIKYLIQGIYLEKLHQKKVNELVAKLEILD